MGSAGVSRSKEGRSFGTGNAHCCRPALDSTVDSEVKAETGSQMLGPRLCGVRRERASASKKRQRADGRREEVEADEAID